MSNFSPQALSTLEAEMLETSPELRERRRHEGLVEHSSARRSEFLQRLEASGPARRSLHDLVDSDSDAVVSPGAAPSRSLAACWTLPRPPRPQPLAEVSEAPVRKKAQGSPSEQSTAPTAGEDAAQEAHELPGEASCRLASNQLGGSYPFFSAGDGNPAVVETNPELLGMEEMLSAEVLSAWARGSVGGLQRLRQVPLRELQQSLGQASRRAKRLWTAVESLELLVHELEERLKSARSGQSRASEEQKLHAAKEEAQLLAKIASLKQGPAEDRRRQAARLRARIAGFQQERESLSQEVSSLRCTSRQLETEVEALRGKLQAAAEAKRRKKEVQASLRSSLAALLPGRAEVAEESLPALARRVGQTWAEARTIGDVRQAELQRLKDQRCKLDSRVANAQASVEAETQRLVRAEEEVARLSAEHKARESIAKEELAVARAAHAVLSEDRSMWLQTRPRLLNLIEDLHRPARPSQQEGHAAEALRTAEKENQELQEMVQALERDKTTLIQDQEELIQRVRERVAPLQQRLLAQQPSC